MANPTDIPVDLITRLARLMEPWQLEDFLDMAEAQLAAGKGYGWVQVEFSNRVVSDVTGGASRKPRRASLPPGGGGSWLRNG